MGVGAAGRTSAGAARTSERNTARDSPFFVRAGIDPMDEQSKTSWRRRLSWKHGPHRLASLLGAITEGDPEGVKSAVAAGGDPLARGGEALALANRLVQRGGWTRPSSESRSATEIFGWLLGVARLRGVSGATVLALPAFAPHPPSPPRYRTRDGRVLSSTQSRRVHALKRERMARLSAPFFAGFHSRENGHDRKRRIRDGIVLIAEAAWQRRCRIVRRISPGL
jgi:hypothetical protein